ncbi:MAG TPA: glycine betaine ABC transporter substrate-binding protein [Methylibium sp.]|uniref:glycine betaine ABC transporter substrate-binding protein n=1 Tax=Methylibium sp. TaxID=2067992 RepID=UPI002DBEE60E|nr:glycine betaine ABC transporter substrate-binding protein [Methylibium sp.]HEU4460014.1 glycine betaine ABC transporter substrate-binding protein [Methylibium sp.]
MSAGRRALACWAAAVLLVATAMAAEPVRIASPGEEPIRIGSPEKEPIRIGSKRFTESYVLGEILRETAERAGIGAVHRQGLGNTGILEQALASGEIDVYPEYTGTIVRELLKREGRPSLDELNAWLAPRGLKAAVPLGFDNRYALALREADAERLGLQKMSDLRKPEAAALRWGLSHEFLARADGWPALRGAYGLKAAPRGLDHGLAYGALAAAQIDVTDVYSTDAQIGRLGLRVLADDLGFFPKYEAVLLMRRELDAAPFAVLAGRIGERRMIDLNAQAEVDRRSFASIAQGFVASLPPTAGADARPAAAPAEAGHGFAARLFAPDLARLVGQHLLLVFGSVLAAVLLGVPLGVWAWARPRVAPWMLGMVGVVQTLPSLALLTFLIAALDHIGAVPALIALFLYALLPIVRNAHAGLVGVPAALAQAGLSLGLRPLQVLRHVQLPLAMPTLLAGVKTAAVINVGTATIAAFVGAGGLGERIVAGLALNDTQAMLAGAVPAAVLALFVQWSFDALERQVAPRRQSSRWTG